MSLDSLKSRPWAPANVNAQLAADAALTSQLNQLHNLAAEYGASVKTGDALDIETTPDNAGLRKIAQAQRWFVASDMLAIALSAVCAVGLTSFVNAIFFSRDVPWADNAAGIGHMTEVFFIACGLVLWFENHGHYRKRIPFWMELQKVVNACGVAMMVDVFMQFVLKQDFSRLLLLSGWAMSAVAIITGRRMMRALLAKLDLWHIKVLLVGEGDLMKSALNALKAENLGYDLAAQIRYPSAIAKSQIEWADLCDHYDADYVMLAMDGVDAANTDMAIAHLQREGIPFSVFSPLKHLSAQNLSLHYFFGQHTFLMVCDSKLEQLLPRFMKRSFDVLGALSALIILSPVMLALTLAVRKDGGPALFWHKRIGMDGKPFRCLKFRSMLLNADRVLKDHLAKDVDARAEWERDQKLKDDVRVTRVGKFLRKTSLDELPQLLNVLRGEMSLVGPRPIVVAEAGRYDSDIRHYYRVRPGITGIWQVSGRNDVSYSDRVSMDAQYVRNWSFWLDVTIICKTFPALLNRKGAY